MFIYIVEVRERMLILAASRLSMMALGREDRTSAEREKERDREGGGR